MIHDIEFTRQNIPEEKKLQQLILIDNLSPIVYHILSTIKSSSIKFNDSLKDIKSPTLAKSRIDRITTHP